mmetsp:Transcript_67399/g.217639  ORF Transcript_67399/g.217639 Transcript_67399/m.217639 type:complete len:336 (-) Transcript_67399:3701-4708(-)
MTPIPGGMPRDDSLKFSAHLLIESFSPDGFAESAITLFILCLLEESGSSPSALVLSSKPCKHIFRSAASGNFKASENSVILVNKAAASATAAVALGRSRSVASCKSEGSSQKIRSLLFTSVPVSSVFSAAARARRMLNCSCIGSIKLRRSFCATSRFFSKPLFRSFLMPPNKSWIWGTSSTSDRWPRAGPPTRRSNNQSRTRAACDGSLSQKTCCKSNRSKSITSSPPTAQAATRKSRTALAMRRSETSTGGSASSRKKVRNSATSNSNRSGNVTCWAAFARKASESEADKGAEPGATELSATSTSASERKAARRKSGTAASDTRGTARRSKNLS